MNEPSDGTLLMAYVRGDPAAFESLVARHGAHLLRAITALIGPEASSRVAQDVCQDTLLKLAQQPPVLPDEVRGSPSLERAHLVAWLHRVARNRAMELLRSEKRRDAREKASSSPESHDDGTEARELRAAVLEGLKILPDDQREALVLRLFHEMSYKEIAQTTGKKIGTVGWLISEGLKVLSARLSPTLAVVSTRESRGGRS